MSFVFFWDITHHQFLSYFDPRALFLQKQGPQKLKGGKANVLKNSKILRRSFFQNIIMHYYCGTNTNFVCGEFKWWVNSTSVKDLPHIQTLKLYVYSGTATITQIYHGGEFNFRYRQLNWIIMFRTIYDILYQNYYLLGLKRIILNLELVL